MREGAVYTARDDSDGRLVRLPGLECMECGQVQPDVHKIELIPETEVPSSMRLRSARKSDEFRRVSTVPQMLAVR